MSVEADADRVLASEPGKAQALIAEVWSIDCSRVNIAGITQWQKKHRDVRVTMIAMDSLDDNAALAQALATMHLRPHAAAIRECEIDTGEVAPRARS
jgi:hypothetical protein